jgi:CDGSH-type Zn-finger protein
MEIIEGIDLDDAEKAMKEAFSECHPILHLEHVMIDMVDILGHRVVLEIISSYYRNEKKDTGVCGCGGDGNHPFDGAHSGMPGPREGDRIETCLEKRTCPECGGSLSYENHLGGMTQDDEEFECGCGYYLRR